MAKKYSLNEIKSEIHRLAAQIGAPDDLLPTYVYSVDGAHPHIEVDSRSYHYIVVERGQEISRVTTDDLDELLYHVFESVTFELACKCELKHRVAHQDFRRLLFMMIMNNALYMSTVGQAFSLTFFLPKFGRFTTCPT